MPARLLRRLSVSGSSRYLPRRYGEVGGNLVSMDMGFGYLQATFRLAGLFRALAAIQVLARRFDATLYRATIVSPTVAGTTLGHYVTRSIGIGYTGGSILLLGLVLISLLSWRATLGRISADDIADRRAEVFYCVIITFSQTLGTALGDWIADTAGLGYAVSAAVFGSVLLLIMVLHFRRAIDGPAILGGIYSHQALGRDGWELLRQIGRPWRPRHQSGPC